MTQKEFIKKLHEKLSVLSIAEAKDAVSFYEEYFADGLEMGKTEEELCARLDLELIAGDIISKSDYSAKLNADKENAKESTDKANVKDESIKKETTEITGAAKNDSKDTAPKTEAKEAKSETVKKENIFCTECGTENNLRFKFCSKCGSTLVRANGGLNSNAFDTNESKQKANSINNTGGVRKIKLFGKKSLVIRDTASVIIMLCLLPFTIPLFIAAFSVLVIVPVSVMFSFAVAYYSVVGSLTIGSAVTVFMMIASIFGISQAASFSIICLYLGGALILFGLSMLLIKTVVPVSKFFFKAAMMIAKLVLWIIQTFFRCFGIIIVEEAEKNEGI